MIAMASQAKRIGRVLVWTRSSRRLTDLRKLDKRLCADRRICVPWRKRFHRPTPPCRCMKCWKLSLALHGELPKHYPNSAQPEVRLKAIWAAIHGLPEKRSALCFSGGGIRSATFGLGVLQGLARCGLLGKFHYLSTVAGGGFIGAWLSA